MSAQTHTASKILELIRQDRLTDGAHLSAQKLADRLRLSRSPVNDALGLLEAVSYTHLWRWRGAAAARPPWA